MALLDQDLFGNYVQDSLDGEGNIVPIAPLAPAPSLNAEPAVAQATKSSIQWTPTLAIIGLHIACIAAPFYVSTGAVVTAAILYWVTISFGIGMGFHRLLTHKGFDCSPAFKYFLTVMGCLTWQGTPFTWVGTHRQHHKDSDQPLDPHSPREGFWWAHIGWCFVGDRYGRDYQSMVKDLEKDRGLVFLEKFWAVPQILLGGALLAFGGLDYLVWGIAVRTVLGWHSTWLVNSACHIFGYRNFETKEDSRNNWWVALLTFGEGWHNNHHGAQRSARHGLRWFEFDMTWLTLKALSYIGVVSNINSARSLLIAHRQEVREEREKNRMAA